MAWGRMPRDDRYVRLWKPAHPCESLFLRAGNLPKTQREADAGRTTEGPDMGGRNLSESSNRVTRTSTRGSAARWSSTERAELREMPRSADGPPHTSATRSGLGASVLPAWRTPHQITSPAHVNHALAQPTSICTRPWPTLRAESTKLIE